MIDIQENTRACLVPDANLTAKTMLEQFLSEGVTPLLTREQSLGFELPHFKMADLAGISALPSFVTPVLDFQDAEIARKHGIAHIVWCETATALEFARRRNLSPLLHNQEDVRAGELRLVSSAELGFGRSQTSEAVAIIGIGAVMPGANDAPTFWNNIKNGVDAISEVPADRWDPAIYWDQDAATPDKTYAKIGGWIHNFEFDRKLFRLPPSVVEKTDPTQLVCLVAVREALQDAGYLEVEFERDRCAVVLGNSLGGDLRDRTNMRIQYNEIEHQVRQSLTSSGMDSGAVERMVEHISTHVRSGLPEVNEDSMPGELANVIAGRVAQTFDIQGPNFVVDAACASSLAAVEAAVQGLRARQFDMAISGGVDRTMGATSFVKFSKIGALSPDGSRPFDADANGFVMGEGAGILILKRLSDAERDGDKIYAVIRGIAGSSDGRGKGITAPNPRGQELAVKRAWQDAGLSPRTMSMLEAHGTSTPVGDPSEMSALRSAVQNDDGEWASDCIAVGSVKSMIGHLKSAAGAAGLIKVAFALKEGVLPPTINVRTVNPKLELAGTRFRIQQTLGPWKTYSGKPRRAGVSAFGFGGTNFHVVLEEHAPQQHQGPVMKDTPNAGVAIFGAPSHIALLQMVKNASEAFELHGVQGIATHILSCDSVVQSSKETFRLSVSFANVDELKERLGRALRALESNKGWKILVNQGVFYADKPAHGKLAMLFPGQGSQYLMMGHDLCRMFPVAQRVFDEADRIMQPILGRKLSEIINPDLRRVDAAEAFRALSQTEVTQPAVLTLNVAILRVLESMGIQPDIVAGHSLGEYGACVAAGVMSFEDALRTVAARGTEMARATPMNGDCGIMASVPASVEDVQAVLSQMDGYVVCANKNCPGQTIIAGLTEPTLAAIKRFQEMGLEVMQLPVSHAFHSKVVEAASGPLRRHLETMGIHTPTLPILTNVTGGFYPAEPHAIRDLLSKQVAAPVEYIAMIETMYSAGARVFVEVGPKRAQATFVTSILGDREHISTFTNHPKRGDIGSLLDALAQVWTTLSEAPVEQVVVNVERPAAMSTPLPSPGVVSPTHASRSDILTRMTQILCDKTGYDPDEIEVDFELEADLGIDTVKQAEIMAAVREVYGFERDEAFRLAEYPTLDHLATYVIEKLSFFEAPKIAAQAPLSVVTPVPVHATPTISKPASSVSRTEILGRMTQILCDKTGYDPAEIEVDFELEADLGIDTVKQAEIMAAVREVYGFERDEAFRLAEYPTLDHLATYVIQKLSVEVESPPQVVRDSGPTVTPVPSVPIPSVPTVTPVLAPQASASRPEILGRMTQILCDKTGYDPNEIEVDFELEADLGIDTVKQAEIMAAVREVYGFERDEAFRLAEFPTLNHLATYVLTKLSSTHPVSLATLEPTVSRPTNEVAAEVIHTQTARAARKIVQHKTPSDVVISGIALGLPGKGELLAEDSVDQLMNGENQIFDVNRNVREKIVAKRIVRLVKHAEGGGDMEEVTNPDDVIRLAGKTGKFEPAQWGLPERLVDSLDDTSQMALAAGLAALHDAGLPLMPRHRTTASGKKVTVGWTLPEEVAAETGVIFASAFAGQDALIEEIQASHRPDYLFNHRYLLRVLGIANSRFAEFVGARGPNTKINSACASTTSAIGMAEDWIRLGRCNRVVIIAADNASGDTLFEWIGSGFLATGAASTKENVEDAALPFDRRRDGMVIGMGCVALVVEASGLPEQRGLEPIADVLATRFVNSALHPTRLDVDHIASEVGAMMSGVETRFGVDRHEIASRTVFVSHETFTPARGGSADAEIASLRLTFGEAADHVVIANTKGFTGHAMGAGIEDVLAVKALQREQLPHIANFKEPDPNLGNLRLSQGGKYQLDYALRLAAGFGSQLALALFRFRARTEDRVFDAALQSQWLSRVTGFEAPVLEVSSRTLRVREETTGTSLPLPVVETPVGVETPVSPKAQVVVEAPVAPAPAMALKNAPARKPAHSARIVPRAVIAAAHTAPRIDENSLRMRLFGKHIAVIAGPMLLTDLMVRALETFGAKPMVFSPTRNPLNTDGVPLDFNDEVAVEHEFSQQTFEGVVNLIGFGQEDLDADETWRAAHGSFVLARAWARLGQHHGGFFLSITGMGGRLGFARAHGPLVTSGAVAGLTKSLAREWDDCTVRLVDVAREGFYPDLGIQILGALDSDHVELGILGGVHWVPTTMSLHDATHGLPAATILEPGSTVLATGGARGITAQVVLDIARRASGLHFVLVGRSIFQGEGVLHVSSDEVKDTAKQAMLARNERVTPMELKRHVARHEAQREIATTLSALRSLGCTAEYMACDMADAEGIFRLVAQVKQPISLVIHGAGVEESRFLTEKSSVEFERVFKGKALGAIALWRAVQPHKPQAFVAFSSVAGRFGNIGQADYSAANEVLNKLVAHIQTTTDTTALSFDWTAWDDVGMATEGSMKDILLARGVELLAPEDGAPMVAEMLARGLHGEFLVAGALGDLAPQVDPVAVDASLPPLVSKIIEHSPDRVVVAREFSMQDRFMRDHVYQSVALVPGVMGHEMMYEAATLLLGHAPQSATDVKFERAIKLLKDAPVNVRAIAERLANTIVCRLESTRISITGRTLVESHFHAVFHSEAVVQDAFELDREGLLAGPDHREIYQRYFHTGIFRVLDESHYVGPKMVIASGRVPAEAILEGAENQAFASQPMLREMAFQAIGIWGMVHTRKSYLPLAIAKSTEFGTVHAGAPVFIRAVHRSTTDLSIIFDAEVRDELGRLLLQLSGVELVGHQALRRDEQFLELAEARMNILRATRPDALAWLQDHHIDLNSFLGNEERAAYERFLSERRRGEWLAARVASKRLVAGYLRDFFGVEAHPSDILIDKDQHKAPVPTLRGPLLQRQWPLPHLTITHSGGIACAAITPEAHVRIGIDLETIEPREPSFANTYFTHDELNGLNQLEEDIKLAALWTCKEAVSKALGLGLHINVRDIRLSNFQPVLSGYTANVSLHGETGVAFPDVGPARFEVGFDVVDRYVFATARLEGDNSNSDCSKKPETPANDALQDDEVTNDLEGLAAVAALLYHKGLLNSAQPTSTASTRSN